MIELKINMDMPVSCACCPLLRKMHHNWCGAMIGWSGVIEDDSRRPEWCPLKEVKEESK